MLEHGMKRKNNSTSKTINTTQGNKPEGTSKERKTKRYRDRIKQYRQNRTFQNNKNYQQVGVNAPKNTNNQMTMKKKTI